LHITIAAEHDVTDSDKGGGVKLGMGGSLTGMVGEVWERRKRKIGIGGKQRGGKMKEDKSGKRGNSKSKEEKRNGEIKKWWFFSFH